MTRTGILAGGNFIIDHVKLIDAWPEQDMLTFIRSETSSNGGGPYNVLKDLAAMRVGYPLAAVGLVGKDANGDWILRDCEASGIDITQLHQTDAAPTSYTDAMTVTGSGRRTFFHQLGTNALLGEAHFDFSRTQAKIFHLGYLMLLTEMDRLLNDGRTVASRVLEAAQNAGLLTSVDLVSSSHPQFRQITTASLPFTDYLIVNEIEAGNATGLDLKSSPPDLEKIQAAAQQLLDQGVRREVIVHFEAGAVVASRKAAQFIINPRSCSLRASSPEPPARAMPSPPATCMARMKHGPSPSASNSPSAPPPSASRIPRPRKVCDPWRNA
jgi:sugar/nucleoside kinase (ribokinase family)